MPAPSFLKGLPKPVLFGLYGAIAGLLGALVGEPLWRLMEPAKNPPPPPPEPALAVSASSSVQVYREGVGSSNTFTVEVARAEFTGPVSIKFENVPVGVSIPEATIRPNSAKIDAVVAATSSAKVGTSKVTVVASGADGKATATTTIEVVVAPTPIPPPRLAVAIPKEIQIYKRGTSKVTVQIARGDFDKGVSVDLVGLPPGITTPPIVIPAGETSKEIVLTADETAELKKTPLTATATTDPNLKDADGNPLKHVVASEINVLDPPKSPVDIMFVLDCSGSMEPFIEGCRDGIIDFAKELSTKQLDFRIGLLAFRDRVFGQEPEILTFEGGKVFTSDAKFFSREVGKLKCIGNDTIPESSLDGLVEAARQPFRQEATRVLLLITDADPLVPDKETRTVKEAADFLKKQKIDQLHTVLRKADRTAYEDLTTAIAGKYFDLERVNMGEKFAAILPELSKTIAATIVPKTPKAEVAKAKDPPVVAAGVASKPTASTPPPPPDKPTVKSLQSTEEYAEGSEAKLVMRSGVWAGIIAALVCLALLSGQHHYLRGALPGGGSIAIGLLGGLIAGIVGGAAGQGLYQTGSGGRVFQLLGWVLLGGLAGVGLSLFIPNMKWFLGLAGGAIGGAGGGLAFIVATSAIGEVAGRIVGGFLVGLCIGLMVAIVEAAFRRAWLEVRFGTRETITVNLGPEPVKIGGDSRACTVWARGAADVALRYFIRDGQVICDDVVMRRESAASNGDTKEIGNVTVVVRTGSEAGSAPPPPAGSRSRPAPAPASKPLSLDDDFDPLPMASSPPPPAAPPPPPRPAPAPAPVGGSVGGSAGTSGSRPAVPPVPPKPAMPPKPAVPTGGSKPAVPPVPPKAPAPKAAPKNPDACPGCGKVQSGAKGTRYCMVCDQTY